MKKKINIYIYYINTHMQIRIDFRDRKSSFAVPRDSDDSGTDRPRSIAHHDLSCENILVTKVRKLRD